MNVKYMNVVYAEDRFALLANNNFSFNHNLSNEYKLIRDEMLSNYSKLKKEGHSTYQIDFRFGIYVYKLLNECFDLDNNLVIAGDPDFWRYLSIEVVPDIVFDRWEFAPIRFYKKTNRIWLYQLWWYIHLTWQNDENSTIKCIEGNSTDTVVQIVDRTTGGFNIELYRLIASNLSNYASRTALLRRVMTLNTMYNHTIIPEFFKDGIIGYVNYLFEKAK